MVEYDIENINILHVFKFLVIFQEGKAPKNISILKKKKKKKNQALRYLININLLNIFVCGL